jgi:Lipocalin-like domain
MLRASADVGAASHGGTNLASACRPLFLNCALLLFAFMQAGSAAETGKNPLIGTWLLVKYADTPENSEPIFAFGRDPLGYFTFTARGHVAFSIMRNPPDIQNSTSDPDPDACIPGWYCAYFGTYTVDTKHGVWLTHVLSANIPGILNTDQPRHFTIDGNTLVVSETYLKANTRIKTERIFVREAAPSSSNP